MAEGSCAVTTLSAQKILLKRGMSQQIPGEIDIHPLLTVQVRVPGSVNSNTKLGVEALRARLRRNKGGANYEV